MTERKKDIFLRQHAEDADLIAAAVRFTARLIDDLENGEVDDAYHYGDSTARTERFMLAGNGPTAYAVFLIEGREVEGYIEYIEHKGALVRLPDWIAEDLYKALNGSN